MYTRLCMESFQLNRDDLLLRSIVNNDIATLGRLLAAGADIDGNLGDSRLTALHHAARLGRVECIRHLLDSGATIDARSGIGSTALHSAAASGQAEAVDVLLEASAETNSLDADHRTALHHAASCGNERIVSALLAAGAKPDLVDSRFLTPSEAAILAGHHTLGIVLQDVAESQKRNSNQR